MRARKVDDNQAEIVRALRRIGCSVAITSGAGDGFPDIVVGHKGLNLLIEIKDGSKSPSQRKLTPVQIKFHADWRGQVDVVESIQGALDLIKYRLSKYYKKEKLNVNNCK